MLSMLGTGAVCIAQDSAATSGTATASSEKKTSLPASLIPVPKGGTFKPRHESFLRRGKEGPIDVLFLGDSITQRWETSGSEVWQKYYGDKNAANFGIGGDRTQHILWRIEHGELDGISPKVLVLMIGTNNSNTDEAPEIVAGVKKIVELIQQKLPNTKLLLLAIFPRNAKRDMPANVPMQRVTAANKELAKMDNGKSIRYLDLTNKFLQGHDKLPEEITLDGVHLTPKGYEIWAESMNPLLQEMLKD
jgi:beta-glucosidase